jgi:hypothetical protein
MLKRARSIREERLRGVAYSEIVPAETRPLVVELVRSNLEALLTAGGKFRRAEAKALHDEGMSMERIGAQFGVSRQRVAALLRECEARAADPSLPDAIAVLTT